MAYGTVAVAAGNNWHLRERVEVARALKWIWEELPGVEVDGDNSQRQRPVSK